MTKKSNATIYDIAREANVSPSMVSRVYNQKPGVSRAKRELIEGLLEKYNYVPDEFARSLKKQRTKCIGIIVSDVCNPFFARILYGCNQIAEKNGYLVFSYETHDVPEIEMKELSAIVLEMLASLNCVNREKERLIEITADGKIEGDEIDDFIRIQEELEKISITVETLQLWAEKMLVNGIIDPDAYRARKQK